MQIWIKGVPPSLSGAELRRRALKGNTMREKCNYWNNFGSAHVINRGWVRVKTSQATIVVQYENLESLENQGFYLYEEGAYA